MTRSTYYTATTLDGYIAGEHEPLFPRQHDLALVEVGRNGDFVVATYDVVGPRVTAGSTGEGRSTGEAAQNSS